jgi:Mrp family chromosome partitioning ATPase/capsular polysaccharide biosynthesis protein
VATRQPRRQDDFATEPRSIELRDYGQVVRRRRAIILVAAVLGAVLGYAYSAHSGTKYSATAEVVVTPVTQGPLNPAAQPNLQVNMPTEQAVAQSAPVAVIAARIMHSTLPRAALQAEVPKHLTVTVPALSDVLQIAWQDSTPARAQLGANAFAQAYLQYRHTVLKGTITRLFATLSGQQAGLQRQIRQVSAQLSAAPSGTARHEGLAIRLNQLNNQLTTANTQLASLPTYDDSGGNLINAAKPLSPSGLGHVVLLVLGALVGVLAGLAIAFTRDAFDDRVRDPGMLERGLGAGTLAVLPRARSRGGVTAGGMGRGQSRRGHAVITVTNPSSRIADAIRSLRATLVAMGAGRDLRTIVVVAADSSVSSSQVAAELGVALAESGRRTLLVAADIRTSKLPQIFDLPNTTGLTNLLVGDTDEVLTQHPKFAGGVALPPIVAQRLALIASGPRHMQPLSVLDSKAMVGLLKSRRDSYDFVVLDSPSADEAADYVVLAGLVDGVVVVAREATSRGSVLEDLRQRLNRVGAYVIGGVFMTNRGAREKLRQRPAGAEADVISGVFPAERAERPGAGRAGRANSAGRPAPVPPGRPEAAGQEDPHRLTKRQL